MVIHLSSGLFRGKDVTAAGISRPFVLNVFRTVSAVLSALARTSDAHSSFGTAKQHHICGLTQSIFHNLIKSSPVHASIVYK